MNITQVTAVMLISSTILFSQEQDLIGLVIYIVTLLAFAICAWSDNK